MDENAGRGSRLAGAAEVLALGGFAVYALAAPHSIAGAWMGLSAAVLGWLARALLTGRTGLRRTPLDLPLWLFIAWTVLSSLLSVEPGESLPKLVNVSTFLMFYLAQAVLTRRTAVTLAALMIASGVAGTLWGVGELTVGRGVVLRELKAESPLRASTALAAGDAVWRVNKRRVGSAEEIDEAIRQTRAGERLKLSVIKSGEHVEWDGPVVTEELKRAASPSGIVGGGPTRSFRASGWTRHYGTFAEVLQMIAQLALGFALARWRRRSSEEEEGTTRDERRAVEERGRRAWLAGAWLPFAAFALLAAGIALTAMRTVLVAFAVGACVVVWRATAGGRARVAVGLAVVVVLSFGALAVWRTRAEGALLLRDASASLRLQVARVAFERSLSRPLFGHGMDAVHRHWQEWGFPGTDMLHAHSTPLQIAFDRGFPALFLWLWLMLAFWLAAARAEKMWRESDDASTHGFALGITGALAGFLASSLVNYNFGDAEVALLLWWLMGASVAINREQ
ncbi:MAG TPA: O-antigen ligase family protein [Pyrinomonadaceae bacterium]|nr:O-antigen ligase family protein [Pyrinomonadaceae bacterium]